MSTMLVEDHLSVSGYTVPLTTANLMHAYANGKRVRLWCRNSSSFIDGLIQGIRNDSGSKQGQVPNMLLVTIHPDWGRASCEVYVKTQEMSPSTRLCV